MITPSTIGTAIVALVNSAVVRRVMVLAVQCSLLFSVNVVVSACCGVALQEILFQNMSWHVLFLISSHHIQSRDS